MQGLTVKRRQGKASRMIEDARRTTPTAAGYPEGRARGVPAFLTSFVGRERDLDELAALMARDDARLVTLAGPGGIGKSRLAAEFARRHAASWPDGVWWVSLEAITDPSLVLPAIAAALGIRHVSGQDLDGTLHRYLADRRALLVIDNMETVIAAAPDLARLLVACPGVTMLVTSREVLRVGGEIVFRVPALEIPLSDGQWSLDEAGRIGSVALFLDRARARSPAYTLHEGNIRTVTDICRRLEGVALAVELAAARSAVVSAETLLDMLRRPLDVLAGGMQDAPPRHRAMRDTIAWSYSLLTAREQEVFRHLAVFMGRFSLDAAMAVVPGGEDILDVVASLVGASLVLPVDEAGESRYALLDTLRQFGVERLVEAGEDGAARDRHARWFEDVAYRTDYCWFMPLEQGEAALREVGLEQGNLREALEWLERAGEHERALRMAASLASLWIMLGNFREGQERIEGLLADRVVTDPVARLRAILTLSWISNQVGNAEKALRLAEEGLAMARREGEPIDVIRGTVLVAIGLELQNAHEDAVAVGRQGLDLMREAKPTPILDNWITTALIQAATDEMLAGHLDRAEDLMREAVMRQEAGGYPAGMSHIYGAHVLDGLGHLARTRGEHALALGYYQRRLVLSRRFGHLRVMAAGLANVAGALAGLGNSLVSARLLGASEGLHETIACSFNELMAWQRALGLPEPLLRVDESFGIAQSLREAVAMRTVALPPITVPEAALAAAWAEGRTLSLEAAVDEALAAVAAPSSSGPAHDLTRREVEILRLLVGGHTNREIGDLLSISERTVEHHAAHIFGKFGVSSRSAAVVHAIRHGLA
jgi:non-specific serine/threonine protein kinase